MKLMKPLMTVLALVCLSAPAMADKHDHGAAAPASGKAAPVVGQAAPDFTGTDVDSKTVKLSDLKGKIVVLEWNNPECPFVVKHYDTKNMQKLQTEAAAKPDVVWLTINSGAEGLQGHVDAAKAKEYITKSEAKPAHYIIDSKGEIGQLYQAKTTPHMFVIDKEGVLAYAGAIDDNPTPRHEAVATAKNYVTAAIEALSAGKKVEVATSQPYGCGVKYSTN